jgi:hypothetical protein
VAAIGSLIDPRQLEELLDRLSEMREVANLMTTPPRPGRSGRDDQDDDIPAESTIWSGPPFAIGTPGTRGTFGEPQGPTEHCRKSRDPGKGRESRC